MSIVRGKARQQTEKSLASAYKAVCAQTLWIVVEETLMGHITAMLGKTNGCKTIAADGHLLSRGVAEAIYDWLRCSIHAPFMLSLTLVLPSLSPKP